MKRLLIAAAFFIVAPLAAVQAQTIVSGTIQDPAGIPYASGSVKAQLVMSGGAGVTGQPTVTVNNAQQCASAGQGSAPCQLPFQGTVGPFAMNSAGGFTVVLQDNALVTPAGTQWLFTVTETPGVPLPFGFGSQSFSVAVTITGASQDISANLNAVAPLLARFAGLQPFTGAPTGACTAGQLAVDVTTGQLYTCNGGTWTPATVSSGAGPPVGACTGNQVYLNTSTGTLYTCSGATWTPASTGGGSFSYSETGLDSLFTSSAVGTNLTQTATLVPPGTALMGPYPGTGTSNPVFETSTLANGAATPATGSAVPAAASSVAIFAVNTFTGSNPGTPTGFTNLSAPSSGFGWFYKNLSSTAAVNVSSSFLTTSWASSLALLGGQITSIPHTQLGMASCGTGCISGSLGPVASGNTILVYARWASSAGVPRDVSCSDTLGDSYQVIAVAVGPSGTNTGHIACMAQNAIAGTPTITVRTSVAFLWAGAVAFELAGTGAYYTGPNGPWTMRPITPADLAGATGGLGFSLIKFLSVSGATICTPPSASTYDACGFTASWTQPFPDTNYFAVCFAYDNAANGGNSATNDSEAVYGDQTAQTAASIKIIVQNLRSIANKPARIDCIGIHP